MKNTKAQVNQAFIFIFMLIIIGSITIVSFQLFTKGQGAACEADIASYRINLEKLSSSFTNFATVNVRDIKAPCSYETACFISTTKDSPDGFGSEYFVVRQILELPGPERDNNVFLVKDGQAEPIALIPEIDTPTADSLCINREGSSFKIKFTGKGQTVEVDQG